MKKEDQTPSILYNYRPWNGNYKLILEKNEIYFSAPKKFNDPFDASTPYRYNPKQLTDRNITKKLHQIGRNIEGEDKTVDYLEEIIESRNLRELFKSERYVELGHETNLRKINSTFGIFCLSALNNDILMWSHYANSHNGICIGFDSKALKVGSPMADIHKVIYSKQFPYVDMFKTDPNDLIKQVKTKSFHWRYEKEYRLIKILGPETSEIINPEVIKELVFGCNSDPAMVREIREICKYKFKHIKLYVVEKSNREYKLNIVPCTFTDKA